MAKSLHGGCLCGQVTVTATQPEQSIGACHCTTCRQWGGGPFMGVGCGSAVSFSGEDAISCFDSSEWAERGFCRHCGSHLYYRLKQQDYYVLPIGLFADSDERPFDHQVFIEQKPTYYHFANDTKNLTGEELFAQFAEPSA